MLATLPHARALTLLSLVRGCRHSTAASQSVSAPASAAVAASPPPPPPPPPAGDLLWRGYSLPGDLRPTRQPDGGWLAPALSARAAARLRKQSIFLRAAGADAPDWSALDAAAWRPSRAAPAVRHARLPKGARADLSLQARVDKVTAALAQVDKRAADYRKSLPPKPIAEGLLVYVKKQAWER